MNYKVNTKSQRVDLIGATPAVHDVLATIGWGTHTYWTDRLCMSGKRAVAIADALNTAARLAAPGTTVYQVFTTNKANYRAPGMLTYRDVVVRVCVDCTRIQLHWRTGVNQQRKHCVDMSRTEAAHVATQLLA